MSFDWIRPDWPVANQVKSIITTRQGGMSQAPFASFNLATHVGDNEGNVKTNRQDLINQLNLPSAPFWLTQTHGRHVALSTDDKINCEADAVYSDRIGDVCSVLTADCLPLLMCDQQGTQVAAVHAGWRGLEQGVIEQTLRYFTCPPNEIMVWLGPAISIKAFEVGDEVKAAFLDRYTDDEMCFSLNKSGRWMADLYQLARNRLVRQQVGFVAGGQECTFTDDRFFSYRRDGITGRMASLIWLEGD